MGQDESHTLEYQSKPLPRAQPSFARALLFGLPGSACWVLLLLEVFCGINTHIDYSAWFAYLVIIPVVTALASVVYYATHWRELRAWYVILCLCINIAGLLFVTAISIH